MHPTVRGRAALPLPLPYCNVPAKGQGFVIVRLFGPAHAFHCHHVPFAHGAKTRPCFGDKDTCPHCLKGEEKREHAYVAAEELRFNDEGKRVWVKVKFSVPRGSFAVIESAPRNVILRVEKVARGKLKYTAPASKKYPSPDAPVNAPFDIVAALMERWFPDGPPKTFVPANFPTPDMTVAPEADERERLAKEKLYERFGVNSLAALDELLAREPATPIPAAERAADPIDDAKRMVREQCDWHGSSLDAHARRQQVNDVCSRLGLPPFAADHAAERALAAADYDALAAQLELRGEPAAAKIVADTRRRRFAPPDAAPGPVPTPGVEPSNCSNGSGPASPHTPGHSPSDAEGRTADGVASGPGLLPSEPARGGGPAPRPGEPRTAPRADASRTAPRADAPRVATTVGHGGGSAPVVPGRAGPRGRSGTARTLSKLLFTGL